MKVFKDRIDRGGSRIAGKGVRMYKGSCTGFRFAEFISYFLKYPMTMNNLIPLRPNYFVFIGYLFIVFVGGGGGG